MRTAERNFAKLRIRANKHFTEDSQFQSSFTDTICSAAFDAEEPVGPTVLVICAATSCEYGANEDVELEPATMLEGLTRCLSTSGRM